MSYTNQRIAYGKTLVELGKENKDIVVLDADLSASTMGKFFEAEYPERHIELGIAEANMTSVAAGLALTGKIAFTNSFAVFSGGRAFDQIRQTIAIGKLNVKVCGSSSGLSDFGDGGSHQCVEDLAIFRAVPNMTVLSPSDYDQFKEMLNYAAKECTGPVCVRYPKCSVPFNDNKITDVTKGTVVKKGEDILILSCGRMVYTAVDAAKLLEKDGISACVVNLGQIKPFDKEIVLENLAGKRLFVTIEDNVTDGGMGQYVSSHINCTIPKLHLGFDTCFVPHGKQDELFKLCSLDSGGVYQRILKQYNAQRNDV